MNLVFTCGGTGGHINPALAVAKMFRERYPDCNILFIGGDGMEQQLIPREGFRLETLKVAGFQRKLTPKALWHNGVTALQLAGSLRKARKILQEFKADAVIGTGGYASFPALYAAQTMGIPTCVHESNALPGITTKLAANGASRVLVAFEESVKHYKNPEKVEVVGMPVRREFIYTKKEEARKELGLDSRPLVVSAFGSLGAKVMNETMAGVFALEQADGFPFQHIHATGSFGWEWMPGLVKEKGVDLETAKSIDMREYIFNMPTLMAAADVIISRAGASTVNEIGASGTPSILIPSPNVTANHQEKNARVLSDRDAAVLVLEKDCTPEKIYQELTALLGDEERCEQMRRTLYSLVRLDSTERICDIVEELIRK